MEANAELQDQWASSVWYFSDDQAWKQGQCKKESDTEEKSVSWIWFKRRWRQRYVEY